jgi:hypothetical protein
MLGQKVGEADQFAGKLERESNAAIEVINLAKAYTLKIEVISCHIISTMMLTTASLFL